MNNAVAYGALTLTAAFFAGNTIVGRAVIGELPPLGLAFWRSFGAFLIIAPFGAVEIWRLRREVIAAWKILFALGVLGMTAFSILVFLGLHHTEAINGTLIQGTLPLNIVLASLVMLGQTISPRQGLGLVVGGLGFAAIVLRGEAGNLAGLFLNPGDALIWIGVFCYALFSIFPALGSRCTNLETSRRRHPGGSIGYERSSCHPVAEEQAFRDPRSDCGL